MVSSRPEIGSFRGQGKRWELPPCLAFVQLRAGRHGGDPGRENSLPEWVPVTFCDREPAGMVRRGARPLSAGPRSVTAG